MTSDRLIQMARELRDTRQELERVRARERELTERFAWQRAALQQARFEETGETEQVG